VDFRNDRVPRDLLVVPNVIAPGGLAVPADGRALVYSECTPRSHVYDQSTTPPTLVMNGVAVEVSATGDTLAWTRRVNGALCLFARGPDGRTHQLTGSAFGGTSNGKLLAFRSTTPRAGIQVIDITADPRNTTISYDSRDAWPHWLDDRELVFARTNPMGAGTAWVVATADGRTQRTLPLEHVLPAGGRAGHVLGVTGTTIDESGVTAPKTRQLVWVDEASGAQQPGPDTPTSGAEVSTVTTSPDGRWLVYATGGIARRVYRRRLEPPGEAEAVAPVIGGANVLATAITNNGHVIVVVLTWAGDLHVIPAAPGSTF
jgi:hypothetical protein